MHADLLRGSDETGTQLRLMIFVVTLVGAGFGLIILGTASRAR